MKENTHFSKDRKLPDRNKGISTTVAPLSIILILQIFNSKFSKVMDIGNQTQSK